MQRFFAVSPPSVHQMVLNLERQGFISRAPHVARSIQLLIEPENLPSPPLNFKPSKPLCTELVNDRPSSDWPVRIENQISIWLSQESWVGG